MTKREYQRMVEQRQSIIRANAGRRIKGLPPLDVPPKPVPPMGWELTDEEGTYAGFTTDDDVKAGYLAKNSKRNAKRVPVL